MHLNPFMQRYQLGITNTDAADTLPLSPFFIEGFPITSAVCSPKDKHRLLVFEQQILVATIFYTRSHLIASMH